jgi:hypothetical protein
LNNIIILIFSDYEVQWYLSQINPEKKNVTQTRNRRFNALKKLEAEGLFHSKIESPTI